MARIARVVAVEVPHHITQRGNGRQYILEGEAERRVYLDLLQRNAQLHALEIVGYCLMSNHVHLVAIPHQEVAMAAALKHTHGRYASHWNAAHQSCGHVWQGRYYSCPLGPAHVWAAMRYAELNPVRAGMVQRAEDWTWSSAGAHCGGREPEPWLGFASWRKYWTPEKWKRYLEMGETTEELIRLRRSTHTGRPFGEGEFVSEMERKTQRRLHPGKGGRPRRKVFTGENGVVSDGVETR
jgi:putative transposase